MTLLLLSYRLLVPLALVFSSLMPYAALAQPAGAYGENFLYRIIANDTLIALSDRYTDSPNNWKTLQSLRSEEQTSELKSLMSTSYAVSCLTQKNTSEKKSKSI